MTKEQFKSIAPSADPDYYQPLIDVMAKYEINTPERKAHFLSQIMHESMDLRVMTENLNYSAAGLLKTFPKYFDSKNAEVYKRQPEKIANRVYGGRMGNGPENTGDGWRYRGRGAIMITGKDNYTDLSSDVGFDFVSHPEWLTLERYSILAAGWYWSKRKINHEADMMDNVAVRRAVNGGSIGLQDTISRFNKYYAILK